MELQVTNFAFWGPLDEERAQVGSFLHSANHSGMVRGPTHHAQDDTGCDQNAELGMIAHAANANDFGCPHCRGGAFAILQLVLETDTHTLEHLLQLSSNSAHLLLLLWRAVQQL